MCVYTFLGKSSQGVKGQNELPSRRTWRGEGGKKTGGKDTKKKGGEEYRYDTVVFYSGTVKQTSFPPPSLPPPKITMLRPCINMSHTNKQKNPVLSFPGGRPIYLSMPVLFLCVWYRKGGGWVIVFLDSKPSLSHANLR